MQSTSEQYKNIISECRNLFEQKMEDYGTAWRVLRISSVTDQIYIKVNRIRNLQITNKKMINETEEEGFMAIVNYSIIGLIQLNKGVSENLEGGITKPEVMEIYDSLTLKAYQLMMKKNHDYGEAWREMRVSSITDIIYQKVLRTKQIEDNQGKTIVSEGIEANYFDILNYAVFCLIKIQ